MITVPFTGTTMLTYVYDNQVPDWKTIGEFAGDLELVDVRTGRSRTTFHLFNKLDGLTYVMNLNAFTDCLPMRDGIRGKFRVQKQGSSYSIRRTALDS